MRSVLSLIMLAIVAVLNTGFGTGLTALSAADTISFATDWKAQAEHGGFYQALAAGLYAAEGLDVTLRPGGPQTDVPRLMAAGAVDIALASNSFQPFNLTAAGADVKIVMASFQKDPQVFMVHGDDGATGLADLTGRPIFLADSAIATFWPWLKARFGYDDRQIRRYTYSLAPWLVNPGSVQEGYLTSEPFSARSAGQIPKVFLFADAGYQGYAGMVMVRSDFAGRNSDLIARFVRASRAGWQQFLTSDADAAKALILKDNPEMTRALIDYSVTEMRTNAIVGDQHIGCMDMARWSSFEAEMTALDLIPDSVSAADFVDLTYLADCPGAR